jgi:heat shock protein HtpX
MKRIVLFLVTNLAIVVVLSTVAHVLGLDQYLDARGGSLNGLLVFAALFGFGGSLISLALSKWMAKNAMGVQVITQPRNATESWLINAVGAHARNAGIGMPEVGIFESPEPNAFATGASRTKALVAVSTGLLQRMNEREVDAVLGHEISHVSNGDMVTLALIQGVVNTFVIFLSRIIGNLVDRREDGRGPAYFITVIVSEIVLGFLASLIVLWFSRRREFRADEGGAKLSGRANMIAALEVLKSSHQPLPQQFAALGIADGRVASGFKKLWMSHPPLEERIAALRALPVT